jgi:hypothetical protein
MQCCSPAHSLDTHSLDTYLRMETLMGTAMPPPPQLWHLVQPDLLQELQPTSPSDHLVQKHGWTPEPPQLGQGLSEASKRSCTKRVQMKQLHECMSENVPCMQQTGVAKHPPLDADISSKQGS